MFLKVVLLPGFVNHIRAHIILGVGPASLHGLASTLVHLPALLVRPPVVPLTNNKVRHISTVLVKNDLPGHYFEHGRVSTQKLADCIVYEFIIVIRT